MKRPIWATIAGVLAILFGIAGVFGGAHEMSAPAMAELQQEVLEVIREAKPASETEPSTPQTKADEEDETDISVVFKISAESFALPDWYISWSLVIGAISMIVAMVYFSSGVLLLMEKSYAVQAFHISIMLSITWVILQSIVYIQSDSGVLLAQIPAALASVVIDVMLLLVVFFGRKVTHTKNLHPQA